MESKTLLQKVFNSTFSKRNYLNGNKKSLSDAWNYNYPKNFKKSPSSSEFFFLLLNENNTTTIFKSFVLFENYKIINIGSSYIKVTGFFKQKNSVDIMKLEIRPTNTKTRIYKFMISSQEIRNYINSNFSFDKSKNFLSKINTDILKNITLTQDKIYRKLIIPFKKISQSSGHRFEDLKMLSPDSNLRPINEINFISPYFNAYRVIFKKVKKIGNFFAILSVKKHNVFDFWIIKVHVPRTSRDYSCRLFKSDLIGLSQNFFDETYPIQMIELKKIFEENYEVGYHEFSNKYELLLKMRKIISIVKSNFLDDPGILEEEKSNKFSKFSSKRFIEFVEYKVCFKYNYIKI